MSKHAFLIMAHSEFGLLKKLIQALDDPRNEIFVHIDKNSKDFEINQFINLTKQSKSDFIKRRKVSWGAYSQIQCEINLLKESTQTYHQYYHLLSGVDLPIKPQDKIHAFFDMNKGTEFLSFHHEAMDRKSFLQRIQFYHPLQEWLGHKGPDTLVYQLNRVLLKCQELLKINRLQNSKTTYRKGATWFSITHNFAKHIVAEEKAIQKKYRWTQCADEIFLHTIAWNSMFRDKIVDNSLRYIDWKRGRPYVFTQYDFDELVQSEALFARKFSQEREPEIISEIYQYLKNT